MLVPIGDTPNPRNFTPWVNWSLIAINVGVYLFITLPLSHQGIDLNDPAVIEYIRALGGRFDMTQLMRISAYDLFTFAHGYKPGAPELSDLFACMFLHGGLLHLAGNMLFLWIFGDNVEHRLGRLGYLLAYLGTGVVATLAFSLFAMNSMVPLVGASGAISGVLGIYFHQFPRNRIKVFVALFPFFFDVVLLPARWVLGFYVIVDNLLPFIMGHQSGVAYGAHLGGFIGGLGVAWLAESFGWQLPWKDPNWRVGRRRSRARAREHIENIR
ncbi:MAG: rhomboid family intramembrane serine protease, partial [Deltaproteobacteria bacterium]